MAENENRSLFGLVVAMHNLTTPENGSIGDIYIPEEEIDREAGTALLNEAVE